MRTLPSMTATHELVVPKSMPITASSAEEEVLRGSRQVKGQVRQGSKERRKKGQGTESVQTSLSMHLKISGKPHNFCTHTHTHTHTPDGTGAD